MTANQTPRLKLMSPVDTDPFTSDDFADTFSKLDATPGITYVANYNSLPTDWTSAQNNSLVMQSDNGAMWRWKKPGSGAGSFLRINSLGFLASSGTPVSASTSSVSPVTLTSASVTSPGGRPLRVAVHATEFLVTDGTDARWGIYANSTQLRLYGLFSQTGQVGSGADFETIVQTPDPEYFSYIFS